MQRLTKDNVKEMGGYSLNMEYKAMACISNNKLKCACDEKECRKCEAKKLFKCSPAKIIIESGGENNNESIH